jgi:hypothetical protein
MNVALRRRTMDLANEKINVAKKIDGYILCCPVPLFLSLSLALSL